MSLLFISIGVVAALSLIALIAIYLVSDRVPSVKLPGSRIVITGGSDGLGLHLAHQLLLRGANLVIIARDKAKLLKALNYLQSESKDPKQVIQTLSADVSDAASIQPAIKKASELLGGGIDVFINNAGITHPERFDTLSTDWMKRCMNVNYFGNVNCIQAVLPIMKNQSRGGRIISVSSVLGLFGCMGYSSYAPSKAAILSLYETLQQEYYAHNIHFSVATPASIGTESFYTEEQKIKPPETLELEKDDPILPPDVVAAPIVHSLSSYRFLISPSGFNSHVMTTACAGWGPASFPEALQQILFSSILRFLGLFLFNSKAKSISIKHRQQESLTNLK